MRFGFWNSVTAAISLFVLGINMSLLKGSVMLDAPQEVRTVVMILIFTLYFASAFYACMALYRHYQKKTVGLPQETEASLLLTIVNKKVIGNAGRATFYGVIAVTLGIHMDNTDPLSLLYGVTGALTAVCSLFACIFLAKALHPDTWHQNQDALAKNRLAVGKQH